MKNIYLKILEMEPERSGLVLATVTATDGSTPQKPGSSALFDYHGLVTGTVGGGVVEGRAQEISGKCSQTKNSVWMHYRLDNNISKKEEAICGGEITLLIDGDPLKHLTVFKSIKESISERVPGVLVTTVKGPDPGNVIIDRYWMTINNKPPFPSEIRGKLIREADLILSSPGEKEFRQTDLTITWKEPMLAILEPVFPGKNLVIAGAGHIGKALSHLGKMIDFDVTVIDDREEYANKGNLPDADSIIVKEIGPAMKSIEKTSETFIVIVTRGHNDDAEALKPCIGSGAAYVGMIGSKVKVARMKAEFISNKWANEEQWRKIFTPIGLDIKSKSVEEIALSIAAQLVLVRNSGN